MLSVIFFSLFPFFSIINDPGELDQAYASGNETYTSNITSFSYEKTMRGQYSTAEYWADEVTQSTYTATADGLQCGIWSTTQTDKYYDLKRGILGFDISSIPDGEIVGVSIFMQANAEQQTASYDPYYAFYKMDNADNTINSGDFDSAYNYAGAGISDRLTNGYYQNSIVADTWYEFSVLSDSLDWATTPDANGMLWVQFASMHDMTNSQPVPWESTKITYWNWKDWNTGNDIRYEVTYIPDVPDLTIRVPANAPVDETITGSEVADNITWGSPRCGYYNEGLFLIISGESGAAIDLELVSGTGTVLDTLEDSIRTNGYYYYYHQITIRYSGFVKLIENNHNLVSTWGYQMPTPDSDQQANTTSAVNTEYPQYDYGFARFVKYEDDVGAIHWKTNVQEGEEPDHSLRIWGNGDNSTAEYLNITLADLNDEYFYATDNNEFMNAWRYIIICPHDETAGWSDWDGIIYDLDVNWTSLTAGFLQAVIFDDVNNVVLADSHSAYWYIPNEQSGFIFNLNKSTYAKTEWMHVFVQVGQTCRARTFLPSLKIEILDDTETVIDTYNNTYEYSVNEYLIQAPVQSGNYEVRFTFYGDPTYEYIHDEPFSVAGTQAIPPSRSILSNIEDWVDNLGMDNTVGWWVLLLLGMVIIFFLVYDSKVMRVALPLVYLGLFIIWGKVDQWLIILLALGAALALYKLFRKSTSGGSEG